MTEFTPECPHENDESSTDSTEPQSADPLSEAAAGSTEPQNTEGETETEIETEADARVTPPASDGDPHQSDVSYVGTDSHSETDSDTNTDTDTDSASDSDSVYKFDSDDSGSVSEQEFLVGLISASDNWSFGDIEALLRGDIDGDGDTVFDNQSERMALLTGLWAGFWGAIPSPFVKKYLWSVADYRPSNGDYSINQVRRDARRNNEAVDAGVTVGYVFAWALATALALGWVDSDPGAFSFINTQLTRLAQTIDLFFSGR